MTCIVTICMWQTPTGYKLHAYELMHQHTTTLDETKAVLAMLPACHVKAQDKQSATSRGVYCIPLQSKTLSMSMHEHVMSFGLGEQE